MQILKSQHYCYYLTVIFASHARKPASEIIILTLNLLDGTGLMSHSVERVGQHGAQQKNVRYLLHQHESS